MKKIYNKHGNIWLEQIIKDNLAFVIDPYDSKSSNSVKYYICIVKDNQYAIPVAEVIIKYLPNEDNYMPTSFYNSHNIISDEGKHLVLDKPFEDLDMLFSSIDSHINYSNYTNAINNY